MKSEFFIKEYENLSNAEEEIDFIPLPKNCFDRDCSRSSSNSFFIDNCEKMSYLNNLGYFLNNYSFDEDMSCGLHLPSSGQL